MTKPLTTSIALIIDRSGSMTTIAQATEDALKEFINGQKQLEGELYLDIVLFDDKYQDIAMNINPHEITPNLSIKPRGMTAMLDAIGRKLTSYETRTDKTLIVIATDGLENASKEYTAEAIRELIKDKKEAGWEFTFIGANQDAIETAKGLNIDAESAITFSATNVGITNVVNSLNNYASKTRSGVKAEYDSSDRENAMKE